MAEEEKKAAPVLKKAAPNQPKTHIKMMRNEEQYPPHKHGPSSAEVHIDEVENWARHGWERAE